MMFIDNRDEMSKKSYCTILNHNDINYLVRLCHEELNGKIPLNSQNILKDLIEKLECSEERTP